MSAKKIGLFTPLKSPDAKNAIADELLSGNTVSELKALLDANSNIECLSELDPREAVIDVGDTCLSDLDLFFWYYLPHYDSTSFEFQVLQILSEQTIVIPNPHGLLRAMDKLSAHTILRKAGIPTPEFSLFPASDIAYATKLLKKWSSLLLKPTLGKFGHGILKVDSESTMRDAIAYAPRLVRSPSIYSQSDLKIMIYRNG